MKVNFTVRHAPRESVTVIMFSDLKRLVGSIRDRGKAVFSVSRHTKTSLSIELQSANPDVQDSFAVAHVPQGTEDLKYLVQTQYSFFTGESETRHYLKLTSKQRLPELKRYLECILRKLVPEMETVEAEVVIHDIPELSE